MAYASKTSVNVDRSMSQVRQILMSYKATAVAIAETSEGAVTKFLFEGKVYQFKITYPGIAEERICFKKGGQKRTDAQKIAEIEGEKRRLWRCMVLYIKAAIEAHENGLIDMKKSMVAHMMIPQGGTLYEHIEKDISRFESNPRFMLE